MTPLQETNMRAQISELSPSQLVDLVIQLQNTIETHVNEKAGFKSSINSLGVQNDALTNENNRLESESSTYPTASKAEIDALNDRVKDLTALNEGLQRKLLA